MSEPGPAVDGTGPGAAGEPAAAPGPPAADPVGELVCSARGCRETAAWGLLWNNPRLHTPERRKVWLACDDHRGHLEDYLGVRAFWRSTVPVAELERA